MLLGFGREGRFQVRPSKPQRAEHVVSIEMLEIAVALDPRPPFAFVSHSVSEASEAL
jgi:hypothetical protein